MPGMSILLLGSHEATTELLEHRGAVYSDRPQTTMYGKLYVLSILGCTLYWADLICSMECGGLMVLQPYGERWRRARKLFHPHVHINAVTQYQAVHIAAARTFARNLLSTEPSPDALPALLKADFAETIVKTVYGIDVKTKEERTEYIDNPTIVLDKINEAAIPGRFLVDGLPFRALLYTRACSNTDGVYSTAHSGLVSWRKLPEICEGRKVPASKVSGTAYGGCPGSDVERNGSTVHYPEHA
jgi:cytochrome P450